MEILLYLMEIIVLVIIGIPASIILGFVAFYFVLILLCAIVGVILGVASTLVSLASRLTDKKHKNG